MAYNDALMADPEECQLFVELTGVPTLAPAVGTAHGIYKGEPNIDFDRIQKIAGRVSAPLVLHGGSGILEAQVHRAVSLGMAKMNIVTELFGESVRICDGEWALYLPPLKGFPAARGLMLRVSFTN